MDRDIVRGNIQWLIDNRCAGTKAHFAKRLGKSAGNVKDWLDKKSFPKEDALDKIVEEFGVTREWLRGEQEKESSTNESHVETENHAAAVTDQRMHDIVIEAKTEARIYREIVDKYFGRLETTLAGLQDITSEYLRDRSTHHEEHHGDNKEPDIKRGKLMERFSNKHSAGSHR